MNQVPYPAAAAVSADGIMGRLLLLRHLRLAQSTCFSEEAQDVPLRRGARSRKMPSRITSRAVLKSSTRSQPLLTSPRSAVAAKSLAVNKLLLVGRKQSQAFLSHTRHLRRQGQHV